MMKNLRKLTMTATCLLALLAALGAAFPASAADAPKPDPSGANTGAIGDIVGASSGAPTSDDIKTMA